MGVQQNQQKQVNCQKKFTASSPVNTFTTQFTSRTAIYAANANTTLTPGSFVSPA